MPSGPVEELGADRFQFDLDFRDVEGLIASYAVPGPIGWTVIETGPSTCRERLLQGLAVAGINAADVARVLVTHVHLDHAGGLGSAAELFPRARLFVHREGLAHMLDPSKLVASARRAWGAAADPLWGPVLPVPANRLVALSGGERLTISGGELLVVNTPGHARHHLAFFDEATRSLYTGDAAGVHLTGTDRVRPALPPPDLDLEALLQSVDRMRELEPARLLYTHFGPQAEGARALSEYPPVVLRWRDVALTAAKEDPSVENVSAALQRSEEGVDPGAPVSDPRPDLISGTAMAAQGLLRYFRMRGWIP
ncbi:MAG: MBL fold metallo-hydrolase [Thermoplasmata archaeon]|nr:MBL fold metallo-hydrolase [Thermoplasmata archaeon]